MTGLFDFMSAGFNLPPLWRQMAALNSKHSPSKGYTACPHIQDSDLIIWTK